MDAETKQEFERLHKKLNALAAGQKKETWVGPGWITDLTGWNKSKLQVARNQGIIESKKSTGGGYLYKLESVPQIFIKSQTL